MISGNSGRVKVTGAPGTFSFCNRVARTLKEHREIRLGQRFCLWAAEHFDLRRNRAFGELLVTHPQPRFVREKDLDTRAASRDEDDSVSFPWFDSSDAAFSKKAQMAFAKVDLPERHNDAPDEQRTQHEVKIRISSGVNSDVATSTVTLPAAKRKVSIFTGGTAATFSCTVTTRKGRDKTAGAHFFIQVLRETGCTPVARRICALVAPAL